MRLAVNQEMRRFESCPRSQSYAGEVYGERRVLYARETPYRSVDRVRFPAPPPYSPLAQRKSARLTSERSRYRNSEGLPSVGSVTPVEVYSPFKRYAVGSNPTRPTRLFRGLSIARKPVSEIGNAGSYPALGAMLLGEALMRGLVFETSTRRFNSFSPYQVGGCGLVR
jgi:hypothetical protein